MGWRVRAVHRGDAGGGGGRLGAFVNAREPSRQLRRRREGSLGCRRWHPMLIVCAEPGRVDSDLAAGLLSCPSCRGVLARWGWARERALRCAVGDQVLRPRRARCRGCAGTHVLLSEQCLLRRRDEVVVIGAAIAVRVAGLGYRRIARGLGVPADTVRGWLRRFAERAGLVRAHFTRCAVALDPELDWCCRPGASSRTRLRRLRSPLGRGCCGSVRRVRGGWRRGCRAAFCATRVPSSRRRGELRGCGARERERWENGWMRSVAGRSACFATR